MKNVSSPSAQAIRESLRRAGINARNALSSEVRETLSQNISGRILSSPEYRNAGTIFIYKAVKGEVRLDALESAALLEGKRLVYPLCLRDGGMSALRPLGEGAWIRGRFGIPEPVPELSEPVAPADIDLVICPCAAFDFRGFRLGMGGGYYDRFLPKCRNARIAAAAFEVQQADSIPGEPWDVAMELVFTENSTFRTV